MITWPIGLKAKTDRDSLALEVCNELRAGKGARSDLNIRWQTNEKMYRNQPGASGTQIIEGVTPYHIPLMKPKLDRINGVVHHAITGVEPYVQITCADGEGKIAEAVQNDLGFLLKKSNFQKWFWENLQTTSCTGRGIVRLRYVDGKGFEGKNVHPNDIVLYPATVDTVAEAKTVGMRFGKMQSEVKRLQLKKEYDPAASIIAGWNPDQGDESGRDQVFDRVQPATEIKLQDTQVQLWEFITFRGFREKDEPRWWKGEVALDSNQLLKIEPFGATQTDPVLGELTVDYTKPWFFGTAYESEYGKFWLSTSLAQHLQGLQQAFSDGFNIHWGGSWASGFPCLVISGGSFGEKIKKIHPGDILENPSPVQAQVIGTTFNPGSIGEMMTLLQETADSVVRISQMGQSSQLRSRTTATETEMLSEMQRQAEDQYTAYISIGLKEIFEYAFELYRVHFDDIKATFGKNISLPDASLLIDRHFEIEVNGKATTNSPSARIDKYKFLIELGLQIPTLGIDPQKVGNQIVQALELPSNDIFVTDQNSGPLSDIGGMGPPAPFPGVGMGTGMFGQPPEGPNGRLDNMPAGFG